MGIGFWIAPFTRTLLVHHPCLPGAAQCKLERSYKLHVLIDIELSDLIKM